MPGSEHAIRIVPLADKQECLPVLARWFEAEWEPHYGPEGEGNAEHDLAECCRRDALPMALVALDGDGNIAGTVALRRSSVGSRPGEEPWLGALLVDPKRRRRGIGTILVAAIADQARALGFDALYTSTDAETFLSVQAGWLPLRLETSLRGPITVYVKRLDAPNPG
ncbi:GNAT family N-acetyltransferase [Hoeflea sp. TYP-13]|uniref:GNAT family N-acetyltransferase n=1 Tax=Hoeflea sp. TYP-13 TaxID=3230023 RepID=UPI0034C646E7